MPDAPISTAVEPVPLPSTLKLSLEMLAALNAKQDKAWADAGGEAGRIDWTLMAESLDLPKDSPVADVTDKWAELETQSAEVHTHTVKLQGLEADFAKRKRDEVAIDRQAINDIVPGGPSRKGGASGKLTRIGDRMAEHVESIGRDAWTREVRALIDGKRLEYMHADARETFGLNTLFTRAAGWDPEERETGLVFDDPDIGNYSLLSRMPVINTERDLIKFRQWDTGTARAAARSEGAAASELAITNAPVSVPIEHIAASLPMTEETLIYVDEMASQLNRQAEAILAQIVNTLWLIGNGTAPNPRGVAALANAQSGILTKTAADQGKDWLDKIRTVAKDVLKNGKAVADVAVCEIDLWDAVRGAKDTTGAYLLGHPASPTPQTVWGMPVDQSADLTTTGGADARVSVVGAFGIYSATYLKHDVQIAYGTVGDQFKEFEITMRIGIRGAPVFYRQEAFGYLSIAP